MTYTYSFGTLDFESNDQSIFGPGAASVLQGSTFIGIDRQNLGSISIGEIAEFDIFGQPLDTGAIATASFDRLKLGFEAGYEVNSGSIDTAIAYLANLQLPTNFAANVGATIDLVANNTLSAGSFITQSPTAKAYVDVVLAAQATFSAIAKIVGQTVLNESASVGFDEQFNLIAVDPGKLELFRDVPALSVTANLLNDRLNFKYVPGTPFWEAKTDSGFKLFGNIPSDGSGVTADLGSIRLTYPDVGVAGAIANNTITGDGTSKVLDFNVDLDGFFGLASNFALPGSGAVISALTGLKFKLGDFFELSYDVIDVEAGPIVSLLQDFTITPNLQVKLDFDTPVDIAGVGTNLTSWFGDWADFPEFSIKDTTVITPTFSIGASLNSLTALAFGLELTVEALKAELKINNPLDKDKTLLRGVLGPVWKLDPPLADPDLATLPVYQSTFNLGGFNTVIGDKIVLTTSDSGINGGIDDGINDTPIAGDDIATIDENTILSITDSTVFTNDFDIDAYHVKSISAIDTTGTTGSVTLLASGDITYDPTGQFEFLAVGETATDTFDYTLSDEYGLTDTATVTVTITGVNDAPIALNDSFDIGEDLVLNDSVASNDYDVDLSDQLTFSLISGPARGVLAFNSDGSFSYDADSDIYDIATPGDLFVESFEYEINDGNGGVVRATSTLNVTILDDGETIFGTAQPDNLTGTDGGEDKIYGNSSNDILNGLDGADTLYGENGNDTLIGGESLDTIYVGRGQDRIIYHLGDSTDTIVNFGGVGRGNNPSSTIRAEIDVLQFVGSGFTARNLLLTQNGNNLELSFEGIAETPIILQNFQLERLDNLSTNPRIGNILFDGETSISDSFDVFDVNDNSGFLANRNSVTFLNDRNNNLSGSSNSNDVINAQGGNDTIRGQSGNDLIRGGVGNDSLSGDSGTDTLNGGSGNDTLIGGSEADQFLFDSNSTFSSSSFGNDRLTDFNSAAGDQIVLDQTSFRALTSAAGGVLDASEFAVINSANNSDANGLAARIVYNQQTGALIYNENGAASGLGSGAQFATLTTLPALANTDILVRA